MPTLPVEVQSVAVDSSGNHVVLVRETKGGKYLPIVVGPPSKLRSLLFTYKA